MNIYDEALEEIKNVWNGNPLTYPKKTVEALERAKKVEEFISLCYVETTDTGHEVVFWRDENYEYAKQLLKTLKGNSND